MRSLVLLVGIAACGRADVPAAEVSAPASPAAESANARGGEMKVSAELVPQEMPNVYQGKVTWSAAPWMGDEVWIYRRIAGNEHRVAVLSNAEGQWSDPEALPLGPVSYRVVAQSDVAVLLAEAQINVPKDWVVPEGVWEYPRGESLGRVFLARGAVVQTGSELIEIALIALHSDGGVIETGSGRSSSGRAGGAIRLTAQRASGELTLASRGENGVPGTSGAPGTPGNKGSAGRPTVYRRHGADYWYLQLPAIDPGPGGQGSPGAAGGSGGKGGDSGGVHLEVVHAEGFWPTVISEGGKGGVGGKGGPGGSGGSPGESVSFTHPQFPEIPPTVLSAAPGGAGPQGADGPAGEDGRAGAITVILDGQRLR